MYSPFLLNFFRKVIIIKDQHQINEEIRDREVRLIGSDGAQLGVMSGHAALELAYAEDMDLVKISPTANPPVCKIMNYGKFRFELSKKEKESKKNQKIVEVKEIWLSMTIDTNDMNVKAKQAQKFLAAGNKVKVSIRMRGRQNAHAAIGIGVMNSFIEILKDFGTPDKRPTTEGKNIVMLLLPTPAQKPVEATKQS